MSGCQNVIISIIPFAEFTVFVYGYALFVLQRIENIHFIY